MPGDGRAARARPRWIHHREEVNRNRMKIKMGWNDNEPLTKEDLQDDWNRTMRGYKPSVWDPYKDGSHKRSRFSFVKRWILLLGRRWLNG